MGGAPRGRRSASEPMLSPIEVGARSNDQQEPSGKDVSERKTVQQSTSRECLTMVPLRVGQQEPLRKEDIDRNTTQHPWGVRTTVTLRNLPYQLNRDDFQRLLDWQGFQGQYRLLYLPIDFSTGQ